MKNVLILLFLLILSLTTSAQKKPFSITQDSVIKKWSSSIINIANWQRLYTDNQIAQILNTLKLDSFQRYVRNNELAIETKTVKGTAIYLEDKGKFYLITAKHIVSDTASDLKIGYYIFNVTPYDYFILNGINKKTLPPADTLEPLWVYSDSVDIAILSLQSLWFQDIFTHIKLNKYKPIHLSNIDTSNKFKGFSPIITIGYPSYAVVGNTEIKNMNDFTLIADIFVSSPVVTFGNIGMFHEKIPKFVADITIYPGNSGGPVIQNDKMIGIVSGQITMPLLDSKGSEIDVNSRGNLAQVAKSYFILPLLRQLQAKEDSIYKK